MNTASRLAELTAELVAIPSVTGDEAAIAEHVLAQVDGARLVEGCVVRPGTCGITLVGHLDTVPPDGNAAPASDGERVYGRGAADMKGGLAVMLALADLPVGLVFYPREEGPLADNGLTPLLAAGGFPRTELAIVMEPTDMAVQLGCLGALNVEAVFRGKAAHSARPWLGRNAIHLAAPLLAELAERPVRDVQAREGIVFKEVISATTATGGTARNVIPGEMRINLNFRFAPGRTVEDAEAEVLGLLERHGAEGEIVDRALPGPLCEGNPVLDRLVAMGIPVEPKQAWTDVAQLGAHGVDAVNYGPGETALAHTADESVAIADLEECERVLRALVAAAAG